MAVSKKKAAVKSSSKKVSKAAKKILAVEDISPDSLKDIPYEMLAKEF